jgi:hypothetical protein
MNMNHALNAIQEILKRYSSVVFTPLLSQPKSILGVHCRFQFTLSRVDALKPSLFLNFTESSAEFCHEACTQKIDIAIQEFLCSEKDEYRDIT